MHPAQMEALGKGAAGGPTEPAHFTGDGRYDKAKSTGEVWFYDPGYNKGGMKRCPSCLFTCDFTVDLDVHQYRRHNTDSRVNRWFNKVPTIDRVVGRTRQEVENFIKQLKTDRAVMQQYLTLKYADNDLHAVQDAASDMRDLDAAVSALEWVLGVD